jgi:hypothetical protein
MTPFVYTVTQGILVVLVTMVIAKFQDTQFANSDVGISYAGLQDDKTT